LRWYFSFPLLLALAHVIPFNFHKTLTFCHFQLFFLLDYTWSGVHWPTICPYVYYRKSWKSVEYNAQVNNQTCRSQELLVVLLEC
jgi:hypothetical protein